MGVEGERAVARRSAEIVVPCVADNEAHVVDACEVDADLYVELVLGHDHHGGCQAGGAARLALVVGLTRVVGPEAGEALYLLLDSCSPDPPVSSSLFSERLSRCARAARLRSTHIQLGLVQFALAAAHWDASAVDTLLKLGKHTAPAGTTGERRP